MSRLIRTLIAQGFIVGLVAAASVAAATQEPENRSEDKKEEKKGEEEKSRTDDALGPWKDREVEYVEVRVPYAPQSNTIATKLPVPLQETPANVGSVSAPLLREQDAVFLNDALTNISGINVQAGSGVHDYYVIRGFNSLDGTLLLTDGAVEPEVSYYDVYNIDGVEVLKGPGGFLYGSGPMSGTVNLIRKQPLPGNFAIVGGTLGSFDTYQANLDWNLANKSGTSAFRLNGIYRETDNYRDDKPGKYSALNPSYTMRFSDTSSLNFNFEYVNSEASPDGGIPIFNGEIADVPRRWSYQSPFDFSEQDVYRFQINYQNKLSDLVTLRNKAYFRELDWQTGGTLLGPTLDFGVAQPVVRTFTTLDDQQQIFGNQLEAVLSLGGDSGITQELLVGVEITGYDDDFALGLADPSAPGGLPPIDLFDPVETATSVSPFPFQVGKASSTTIAPYVLDHIKFSRKANLMVGLRYDNIDVSVDYDVNAIEPIPGYDRNDSEVSPMAGFVYSASSTLSAYVNASQAHAPVGPRVIGAAILSPEESTQYEIGVKKKFLDNLLHATVALYRLERTNIPIADPGGFIEQAGDQTSDGIELDLAAELKPRLRLFFSYAYNDSELTTFLERDPFDPMVVNDWSGNTPAFAPQNIANAWVSKSFKRWGIGGGLRYIDNQFLSASNTVSIDSALIVSGAVNYDIGGGRLQLNLKNLTNEEYELRGFGQQSVIPANSFNASLSFNFNLQ